VTLTRFHIALANFLSSAIPLNFDDFSPKMLDMQQGISSNADAAFAMVWQRPSVRSARRRRAC